MFADNKPNTHYMHLGSFHIHTLYKHTHTPNIHTYILHTRTTLAARSMHAFLSNAVEWACVAHYIASTRVQACPHLVQCGVGCVIWCVVMVQFSVVVKSVIRFIVVWSTTTHTLPMPYKLHTNHHTALYCPTSTYTIHHTTPHIPSLSPRLAPVRCAIAPSSTGGMFSCSSGSKRPGPTSMQRIGIFGVLYGYIVCSVCVWSIMCVCACEVCECTFMSAYVYQHVDARTTISTHTLNHTHTHSNTYHARVNQRCL
jgi:hypothetical protein